MDGSKTFEIRKRDRPFKLGDRLILQEYNPDTNDYSGNEWHGEITYILIHTDFVKKGFCIMGIKEKEPNY